MIVSLVASSLGLAGQVVDSGTSCGILGTSGDDFVSYVSIFWRCVSPGQVSRTSSPAKPGTWVMEEDATGPS